MFAKWGAVALATTVFSWLVFTSSYIPFMAEDWCLKFQNTASILKQAETMYFQWTGRLPAHALAMFFLLGPKLIFDILNALCFIGLIGLINRHVTGLWGPPAYWILAFVLVLLGLPAFGESVFWITGSANYLWTTTLLILFLLPFTDYALNRNTFFTRNKWVKLIWPFLSVLAGWTNENSAPAALIMGSLIIGLHWYQTKKIPPLWLILSLAGMVLGIAAMLWAPGNYARLHSGAFSDYVIKSSHERIYEFARRVHKHFLFRAWSVVLMFILAWLYVQKNKNTNTKTIVHFAYVWAFGYILAVGALIFSPYVEPRALTGAIIFLVIATLLLVRVGIAEFKSHFLTLNMIAGGVGVCIMVWVGWQYISSYKVTQKQAQEFNTCRTQNLEQCLITPYAYPATRYFILPRFAQPNPAMNHWANVCRIKSGID
jgi:hypothetical protein